MSELKPLLDEQATCVSKGLASQKQLELIEVFCQCAPAAVQQLVLLTWTSAMNRRY